MPILIRSAGLHLLNWLIPPTCPVCHAETSMTGPDGLSGLLCASCFATLNFIVPPVCQLWTSDGCGGGHCTGWRVRGLPDQTSAVPSCACGAAV
ncbi:double zinc ribbon domain-containing protein [Granulibacter bethesdensis]|uniref:double zinc ribbon domain-containing protein n=1 Tax=Granulibacter bethesdensis TaxID=364410 RepID=UPI0038D169C4